MREVIGCSLSSMFLARDARGVATATSAPEHPTPAPRTEQHLARGATRRARSNTSHAEQHLARGATPRTRCNTPTGAAGIARPHHRQAHHCPLRISASSLRASMAERMRAASAPSVGWVCWVWSRGSVSRAGLLGRAGRAAGTEGDLVADIFQPTSSPSSARPIAPSNNDPASVLRARLGPVAAE